MAIPRARASAVLGASALEHGGRILCYLDPQIETPLPPQALQDRFAAGRSAWPDVTLDEDAFRALLLDRLVDGELPPVEHSADLYIACACAAGVRGAAAAFERVYRSVMEGAAGRVDRGVVDEATQIALVSLLVATPEGPPRIATYSGRASLRTWLATVATRAALKLRRNKDDQSHESLTGLAQAFVADEPELALAKARHGPEVAKSLAVALASLEPRELVLLRLHHAQGWSVDRLGALYRVGRSTAARWVAAARAKLVDTAKNDLRKRLGLTSSEIESLVALLQSNLEVSLVRLLDGKAGDAEGTGSQRPAK